jgi:hypothetical protein
VDVLVLDHSQVNTLQVPNIFPAPPDGKGKLWVVATSTAPSWQWHIVLATMLVLPGLCLLLRRGRAPGAPPPVLHCAGVFLIYFATRLALELTAAPRELCWALGGTPSMLLSLPFFGWYCGARGLGAGGMTKLLLVLALCERLPLIAWGYFATTQQLGTHLDTHLVSEISFFGTSKSLEGDAVAAWLWPTLVPHLTIWIVITVVGGLLLGTVPLLLARRRSAAPEPAPA